jgi:hypothetical protein
MKTPGLARRPRALAFTTLLALVRCGGAEFAENVLVTHRGLSGPAVLQISSYWSRGEEVSFDLIPGTDMVTMLAIYRARGVELQTALGRHLPKRFAQVWAETFAPRKPLRSYTDAEIQSLSDDLHDWRVRPAGTEGFLKAEVT